MTVNLEYEFGDVVYLKVTMLIGADEDNRQPGQITGVRLYPERVIVYEVDWSDGETGQYYGFQLTSSPYPQGEGKDE